MQAYFFLFFLFLVFSVLSWEKNEIWNLYGFVLLSLIVIIVPGFRNISVGTDTSFYIDYFMHPERGYRGLEVDSGFYFFNLLIANVWRNESFYLFCTALLSMSGVIFFVYKKSSNRIISLFICIVYYHFYSLQLSGLRQSVAISLFLFSLCYYLEGVSGKRKAIFFFILSALFHVTVVWCLPVVLLLDRYALTKKKALGILSFSIVVALSGVFDYRAVMSFVFEILGSVGGYAIERYDNYLDFMIGETMSQRRLIMGVLPLSFVAFVCVINNNESNNMLLKLFLVGVVVSNLIVTFPIGNRVVLYFTILMSVILPNVLKKQNLSSLLIYILVIGYYTYNFYSILKVQVSSAIVEGDKIAPYKFFFN